MDKQSTTCAYVLFVSIHCTLKVKTPQTVIRVSCHKPSHPRSAGSHDLARRLAESNGIWVESNSTPLQRLLQPGR